MGIEGTILTMFDRITHESTTELDRNQTIEGLRRRLHGQLPSSVLKGVATDEQLATIYQDEITLLRQQLVEAESKNAELETSMHEIRSQLKPQAVSGFYTMEQFMAALARKLGRTYGWRVDYVEATKQTPGATLVETTTIQHWQTQRLVPALYYDQIETLLFRKRVGKSCPEWSNENYDYLEALYKEDPAQKNRALAEKCSEHFDRDINENSIRGAVDRLRKSGRLPERRPGREKAA